MLMPKKLKHRKHHKGRKRYKGVTSRQDRVSFGDFGMKALTRAWVTSRQIEATRRVLTKKINKGGKVWIRIFPHKPITAKGSEVPMGKGKGSIDRYVAVIKPGMILFEISGVNEQEAKEAIISAIHKLPLKAKFVKR